MRVFVVHTTGCGSCTGGLGVLPQTPQQATHWTLKAFGGECKVSVAGTSTFHKSKACRAAVVMGQARRSCMAIGYMRLSQAMRQLLTTTQHRIMLDTPDSTCRGVPKAIPSTADCRMLHFPLCSKPSAQTQAMHTVTLTKGTLQPQPLKHHIHKLYKYARVRKRRTKP